MSVAEVLGMVATGKITPEQAAVMLPKPSAGNGGSLSCKVSEKGAVSVYGLQRMPVTLYGGQWERLLAFVPTLKAFLEEHKGQLAVKAAKATA